ncbi:MAG: two-component system regulatory protein YycI [Sporolactobacillus sp.]
MNWSKTKSIFILCFLLLDIFLVFELYIRQQDEDMQNVEDSSSTHGNFRIDTQIPATPGTVTFLRGTRVNFEHEKDSIALLTSPPRQLGQSIHLENDGLQLSSTLRESLKGKLSDSELQKNILGLVYQGQGYTYWKMDRGRGTVDFVQSYNGHPVFISGRSKIHMLQFSVKGNNVTGYRQSYFQFKQMNSVDIISAARAISNLQENTNLFAYSRPTIKTIELGYINLVSDTSSNSLIFIPAWHVVVKSDGSQHEFFVNGMSGNVQQLN